MPLLVVPVAPEEAGMVTLAEWDALCRCSKVFFEHPDHPLVTRLADAGIDASPFDDDLPADRDGWALVVDPTSPRAVELARAGAAVTSGSAPAPDPLTAAHGAYLARRGTAALGALALVMARLRSADGCPWDQEQTHESLKVHLLEEAYEVLDSIDRGETGTELEEELGDVLLQVAFHSQLAADDGRFDLAGVADAIVAKLLHRHPHVFGGTVVEGAAEVVRNWETIKGEEKQREGPFEGLPEALPSLLLAYKTQKRASALGFEADAETARRNVAVALHESAPEGVGDALFWLVALARSAGIDPEGALRKATAKFRASF